MDYKALSHIRSDIIELDNSGRIRFGNSIVAEFLLSRHQNRDDVIGAVIRFCQFINAHSEQRSHQRIVRRLLRFWNLSRLFGSTTLPIQVLDKASYIPAVRSDPLFWVQYSIAQMENGNFLPAFRFLARAYKEADEKGPMFDKYQIDTHSARLALRRIMVEGMYNGAKKDILEGVAKLTKVVERRPDDLYHVCNVIVLLLDSDLKLSFHLSSKEYIHLKRDLAVIQGIIKGPSETPLFDVEKQAIGLIDRIIA